ncbi:hypothetical protein FNF27_05019 [Cafeteria roenbergensis]|nr:hypothetical protein FNF29_00644 [Cafeteria roenbergensis]KAA0161955.1 hypothetical protein FNF31_03532 [Cafeteria roenbergensis]KAA0173524.1 hypothetical protein FNF27_05019 [Cafeteria roenbergensis]|eukprot:KAA0157292.1 hypothetical protein FNF29_00644 [Cafeteria roenbergensis]
MADEALAFAARKAGHDLPHGWNTPGQTPLPLLDGPSIVDVNTGFARHSVLGLQGLYRDLGKKRKPTTERFVLNQLHRTLYQRVGRTLESLLTSEFGLSELHFSAPTFVARLQGSAAWRARDVHDEYWHPHVDRNNTAHYHYSALLYLAEGGGEDFSGGEFQFMDPEGNFTVVPRAGRVVIFTSGQEHLHRVRPVTQGVRYAISMWFTCDAAMAMPQFLDGKMHNTFHAKREAGKKRQRRHLPRNHRVKAPKDEL